MNKKILLILALSLTLSACKKDEYVSQRHPDENKKSNPISASVSYKDKKRESGRMVPPLFITETLRLRLSAHPEQKSRSLPASLPADSFSINRT